MNKKILFILLAVAFVVACKKNNDLGEAPRLFRPVLAGTLTADSNTVEANWQEMIGATGYLLQVSRDTFRTVDRSIKLDTNIAVIKELLYNQLYQVQVKALASDTAKNSKWSTLGAIKTLTSILKVPGLDDVTTSSVRVKWTTKGATVSSIKILKAIDSSVVSTVNLNAADIISQFKIVDGLTASTKYIIMLYSGTVLRGYADFTTKAPFAGVTIDLSGITGVPTILADTILKVPSGSLILLRRGETYNISGGISLDRAIILQSKPDLVNTQQAKIYFTANFGFATGAAIDLIEFNDVYMSSDNWGGRYVFNTTTNANIGKIRFANSRIEIFRGVLRLQSGTATVSNIVIENCIVDSIKDYGVITVGAATTKAENISITNSTFYNCEKLFGSAPSSSISFILESCTFNDCPSGNNNSWYIDYNTSSVTNGITVSNCIFGAGRLSGTTYTVKDYRASSTTVINGTNNFRTADHVNGTGATDFPALTTSNRKTSELWVAPAAGNFKIADVTFNGRSTAGDPRWRL